MTDLAWIDAALTSARPQAVAAQPGAVEPVDVIERRDEDAVAARLDDAAGPAVDEVGLGAHRHERARALEDVHEAGAVERRLGGAHNPNVGAAVFQQYANGLERVADIVDRKHAQPLQHGGCLKGATSDRGGARLWRNRRHTRERKLDGERRALSVARAFGPHLPAVQLEEIDPIGPAPGVDPEARWSVLRALGELEEAEQALAIMLFVDGMSQGEAADELGVSRVTVNKRAQKIREQLRISQDSSPRLLEDAPS